MKSTCLYLVFLIICFDASKGSLVNHERPQRRFSPHTIMHQLFEMLRVAMRNASPEEKVPLLDPFAINFTSIDLPGDWLNINVTNALIYGLSSFQLIKADFKKDSTSIDLHLYIPIIKFQAEHYEMAGNLYGFAPVAGKGFMDIEVHDINFKTIVYLTQSSNGKSILVKNIENTEFIIRQFVSHTQFDNNIDDIINAFVKDLLASYFNRFNKFIWATFCDTVTSLLNSFLDNFESWRVIAVIL